MSNRGNIITSFLILCGIAAGVWIGQALTKNHYRDKAETQIRADRARFEVERKQIIERAAVEAVNAVAIELMKAEADTKHWQEEFEKLRQLYNSTTAKLQKQINATSK
jgi:hypothetical protein